MVAFGFLRLGWRRCRRYGRLRRRRCGVGNGRHRLSHRRCYRWLVGRGIPARHRRVGRRAQRRMVFDAATLALVAEWLVVVYLVRVVVAVALVADRAPAEDAPEGAVLLAYHRGEVVARRLAALRKR